MLDVFMYYTLFQFLSYSFKIFQLLACNFISRAENCVYLDQLDYQKPDSQKPADLVLHCFKTGYIKSLAWKRVN